MLIDSHAHLDMKDFDGDRDAVMERAKAAGVGEILNVGYDPASIDETIELTERYAGVYAAVGIHPHNAKDWSGQLEEKIKRLLLRRKVLAVGEIGLDYYRDLSPRDVQKTVFRRQLGIAIYFKMPVVIHCRDAFPDLVDILRREGGREIGGIFHAFSGGVDELCEVLELGFVVGLGGPVTYKNSPLPGVIERLPSDAFVLETDCPYLPPQPHRGERNEPAYLVPVVERLAEIYGVEKVDIERGAESTYRRLLRGKRDFPATIAYRFKGNIYLNVTRSCTNNCRFCNRGDPHNFLFGHNMTLAEDPPVDEMVSSVKRIAAGGGFDEIVFCGYGEPTTRLREIIGAAGELRGLGRPIRLNTNGQGNLINRRNIVPELEASFDRISISLNAPNGDAYLRICRPDAGGKAYDALLGFISRAAGSRMETTVTVVDCEGVDVESCRKVVEAIPGAGFKVRRHRMTLREC